MAGFAKFKVVSIDYPMPPDFRYPVGDPNATETKEHFGELTGSSTSIWRSDAKVIRKFGEVPSDLIAL